MDFFHKVEGNKAKGLEIEIREGKIVGVKDWGQPLPEQEVEEYLAVLMAREGGEEESPGSTTIYSATFGPLTFHSVLTGERSFQDLIWSHGETSYANDGTKLLINTLLPKVA